MFDLQGKVAIVTGGNGLTMAQGLADAGALIAVVGRNPDKLLAAVTSLRQHGGQAKAYGVDGLHERILARTPAGRWGNPKDLAADAGVRTLAVPFLRG